MDIGMLWYDDSPLALKDRVKLAAGYFNEKYGRKPNLCFVHPDMLQTDEGKANGVVIRKGKQIMPGHFWIGVDEAEIKPNGNQVTVSKESKPRAESGKSKAAMKSVTVSAPLERDAKAKSSAKTTAKPKAVKKTRPASAKPASAKPASKKAASAKPVSAKPASAKPRAKAKRVNRTRAYLKKNSGSRVKAGGKPESKSKSTVSKAN